MSILSPRFLNYLSSSAIALGLLCSANVQAMNTSVEESAGSAAPAKKLSAKKSSLTEKELASFLTPHRPKNATDAYFTKTVALYLRMASLAKGKKDIVHDGRDVIMPDRVYQDYGWNNPLELGIHGKLLQFCTQSKTKLNVIDVGPGFGFDTVGMLLTQNVNVQAMEKQKRQTACLTLDVGSSIKGIDETLLKRFRPVNADFLTFPISTKAVGAYDGINLNQVIHFFDPSQSRTFRERAHTLLKPDGSVFVTCLAPTPGSEIEKFMAAQKGKEEFPGYIFYKQRNPVLFDGSGQPYLGKEQMLEVRKPKVGECSAYFLQTEETTKDGSFAVTSRVMHFHTLETLTHLLGDQFSIVDSIVTLPDGTMGTDVRISVVAKKKAAADKSSDGKSVPAEEKKEQKADKAKKDGGKDGSSETEA